MQGYQFLRNNFMLISSNEATCHTFLLKWLSMHIAHCRLDATVQSLIPYKFKAEELERRFAPLARKYQVKSFDTQGNLLPITKRC